MRVDNVRIHETKTISRHWVLFREYAFDYRRHDGTWQRLRRQACDRGDSVAVLPYCAHRGTVLLIWQFRLPILIGGKGTGITIEVPGGLIHEDSPFDAAKRELEEETGIRTGKLEQVMLADMLPALLTERVHLFTAQYGSDVVVPASAGVHREGEDIQVRELPFTRACQMIADGQITDARTILLLQHARMNGLVSPGPALHGNRPSPEDIR